MSIKKLYAQNTLTEAEMDRLCRYRSVTVTDRYGYRDVAVKNTTTRYQLRSGYWFVVGIF